MAGLSHPTDVWGTTQTFTYDLYNDNTLTTTTKTASGRSSTVTYTYDADGQLATVSLDGQKFVNHDFTDQLQWSQSHVWQWRCPNSRDESDRCIGVADLKTSDGKTLRYAPNVAPSQRILSEYLHSIRLVRMLIISTHTIRSAVVDRCCTEHPTAGGAQDLAVRFRPEFGGTATVQA